MKEREGRESLCVKKRVAKRIFREKGTKIFSQHLLPPFSCLYDRPTTVTSPVQTNHPTMPSRKSKRSKKALLQFSSGSANDDDVETLTLAVAGGGSNRSRLVAGDPPSLGGSPRPSGRGGPSRSSSPGTSRGSTASWRSASSTTTSAGTQTRSRSASKYTRATPTERTTF